MDEEQRERYNTALELHNHEFRTLGERSNLFAVIQSILIGALILMMIGQNEFGYISPYAIAGISFVGAIMCLLHHKSGLSGSENAFLWRQYMLSMENNVSDTPRGDMPWKWFHDRYKGPGSLEKFPLPTAWLFTPTIFMCVWFVASAYIPAKIGFDADLAENTGHLAAFIFSATIAATVFRLLSFLIVQSAKYLWCANEFPKSKSGTSNLHCLPMPLRQVWLVLQQFLF